MLSVGWQQMERSGSATGSQGTQAATEEGPAQGSSEQQQVAEQVEGHSSNDTAWGALVARRAIQSIDMRPLLQSSLVDWSVQHRWYNFCWVSSMLVTAMTSLQAREEVDIGINAVTESGDAPLVLEKEDIYGAVVQVAVFWCRSWIRNLNKLTKTIAKQSKTA